MIEKILNLFSLTESEFAHYHLDNELLKRKIDLSEREELIKNSINCGKELAKKIKNTNMKKIDNSEKSEKFDVKKYLKENNINLIVKKSDDIKNYIYFGAFQEPNNIFLYDDIINLGENYINETIEDMDINIRDIIISHELFHYFESREPLYTNTKKIILWSFLSYKHKSKVNSLSEIAAMAFAKKLLDLNFSPSIVDVILLQTVDKKAANILYDNIIKHKNV